MDAELLAKICERIASLEATIRMHLAEHDRLWMLLVPIIAGVVISIVQNISIHRTLKRNGYHKKEE